MIFSGDSRTKEYCEGLAKELNKVSELPKGCEIYPSVIQTLESKEKAAKNPFLGMWAGQATRAKEARQHGVESHAQIQRRLTRMGERKFSNKQK